MNAKILEFGDENPTSNFVIYCNGINANHNNESQRSDLLEQVGLLQTALHNLKIVVFNNPTDLTEYFSRDDRQIAKEKQLANELAILVREKIKSFSIKSNDTKKPRIHLFAHSHGALITKVALEILTPEERKHLRIHTFAGVVMIPNELAKACNYVFTQDMICRGGNKKNDPQLILEKRIKVHQRSIIDNIESDEALFQLFTEDLYAELDPSSDGYSPVSADLRNKKIQKFFNTFWSNNPDQAKHLEEEYGQLGEEYGQYASCLNDYTIKFLSNSREIAKAKGDFKTLNDSLKKQIGSFGPKVDKQFHKLTAFEKIIKEIAKKMTNS